LLKSYFNRDLTEAGCDEAGRGCIAGPVCAAAVILPKDFTHDILTDSKMLTEKQRDKLRLEIEAAAVSYSVAFVDNDKIDEINILRASIHAMHLAVKGLEVSPGFLLIDGNKFIPYKDIPYKCFVKGDSRYYSIAAASILAKTYRDEYMTKLHQDYSHYAWNKNKGYPTKEHRKALSFYGISKFHRKSFRLLNEQLELKFS
jgi:ribonuclease HII